MIQIRFEKAKLCIRLLSSLLFHPVLSIRYLAALDLGAGVEQPFNCLIIQNRQAVQSMERSMD